MTSATAPQNPRIPWVDYAKGICIILVVMMHSTLGVEEAMGREGFMHAIVEFARPFRIPAFFLVSGLFLSRVIDREWRLYADRKVVHFAYFYLLWLSIQGLLKWLPMALHEGPGAFAREFGVALVQPFGTLWFIYLLAVFFLVAKVLRPLPPWLVLVGAAILEMAPIETASVVIDEFASRFIYFALGWLVAPYVFAFAKAIGSRALPASIGLLAWAAITATAVLAGISLMPGVSLLLGALGCLAVVALSALLAKVRTADFIRYCGEHSIAIYLAFFLPMAATRIVLVKTGVIDSAGIVALIVTIVAIVCPLILLWLTQWTGWGRFLFERPAAFSIDQAKPRVQPAE